MGYWDSVFVFFDDIEQVPVDVLEYQVHSPFPSLGVRYFLNAYLRSTTY